MHYFKPSVWLLATYEPIDDGMQLTGLYLIVYSSMYLNHEIILGITCMSSIYDRLFLALRVNCYQSESL